MRRNLYLLYGCCSLLFILFTERGYTRDQVTPRHFRNISVNKGLSQGTVFAVMQDTLGFMWMATQDGLNRYDGQRFTVYKPVKNNPHSLQSYYIKRIFIDKNGELWIGGNQGVSSYHYEDDSFSNYRMPRKSGEWFVSAITSDQNNRLWAASSAGDLYCFDTLAREFRLVPLNNALVGFKNINQLTAIGQGLLLSTDAGLFKMDLQTHQLNRCDLGIAKPSVNDVFIDDSTWWIATEGSGLIRLNPSTGKAAQFLHQPDNSGLADNDVRSINKDAHGNIWVGTFRGLSILDRNTGHIENYFHQATIPYTISQNSVRYIYRDKQHGMWLGTYYGGVNYYHESDILFSLLNQNTGPVSLSDQVINVIRQDNRGNFWIGTNDKGLNYWNPANNTIHYYTHTENAGNILSSNNVKSIAFGPGGTLLAGTHNAGLNVMDPATGANKIFRHQENDPGSIAGDMVYSLLTDSRGHIWVGTRSGLDLFDPVKQTFIHYLTDRSGQRLTADEITFLFEDSHGDIWIGTTNGVNQFHTDSNQFITVPGTTLSNDVVNCIAEDGRKRIWIGTRDGLNLYQPASRTFVNYHTANYLPAGAIYGIQPDDDGNLWISTSAGLLRFNPDTHSRQFFDTKDGIENSQFNLYAYCKAADGMLLFGGTNGISYFYPASLKQQPLQLGITFTGLEVLNRAVFPGDGTGILEQHINKAAVLTFSHEVRQFSLLFNSFNYISGNRTQYFYKLEGFDADWQQTENIPKATYTNLPSGRYIFYVKAIGPQGETSLTRSIRINILPPWYKSTWFILLLVALMSGVAYLIYRMFHERYLTRQQLKAEREAREKVNYINQVKMDFFTNVSHELRTPLTLMLAPLEEIMRQPDTDKSLRGKHELILANTRRLYQLVNQLFEFRKTEMGTRKLVVCKADIVSFVQEIYLLFKPLAEKHQINYQFRTLETLLYTSFDQDAVEKIISNLLSNAFKYTVQGDDIVVDLEKEAGHILIKITDTGKGIAEEHQRQIFDRFYQVSGEEMNLGSGVGLAFTKRLVELHHGTIKVESAPGSGSTFTVSLPLSDEAYVGDLHHTDAGEEEDEEKLSAIPPLYKEKENITITGDTTQHSLVTKDNTELGSLLIVDDNEEITSYLSAYFGKFYRVKVAYNGREALVRLDEEHPDLIISDVMMPELDGLHFCRRVKQNIQTCHIPVLLLTAKAETSQQIAGLEMGADDYITKPFSIALLEAKVQGILRIRRQLREYYSSSGEIIPEKITFNNLDEAFIRQAIAIVETNLLEYDFSVDKFSREIGMSRSNLYLKLKAITGESVTAFIKRIRFHKAVELLESRQYTIAEISIMSGFNSPSYFSTAFRQHYGCMPSEYLSRKDISSDE
ncbi:two-component regulator propeller domain-containing protein [Chitinophaga sp. RAB17]|uniref:hybrid sensor histidine kinase/response regulator transcription factor n=1 Tax=Chitinophaga sp. RAB17 TaxID=3233049 RepID=UPI003F8E6ACB